jgi:hypothetical protein
LQIQGVTLRSYRYAWAERAKTAELPGRWLLSLGQRAAIEQARRLKVKGDSRAALV